MNWKCYGECQTESSQEIFRSAGGEELVEWEDLHRAEGPMRQGSEARTRAERSNTNSRSLHKNKFEVSN